MGKKKTEITSEEFCTLEEQKDILRKEINDKYGEVLVSADTIVNKNRKIVKVSPMADHVLNGGIPEGSWLLLSGPPKCGKSVTALQIAANAQEQYGKPIYIGNIEHRINEKELVGIHNLDPSKVEVIQSRKGKILTAQDFLDQFNTILKSIPECVLIIDSTSALCAEGEFASEMKSAGRNDGPKLLAQFCRKLTSTVPVQQSIVIVIQHLICNTSGYGEAYYEDGGKKIQHQGDTKLRCTSSQKWENKAEEQIGQVINWHVKTAALTKPGTKFQSYLRYGYGLDDVKEYTLLGMDMGIIEKGGAWFSFDGNKVHGEENLRLLFVENKELLTKLQKQINQIL